MLQIRFQWKVFLLLLVGTILAACSESEQSTTEVKEPAKAVEQASNDASSTPESVVKSVPKPKTETATTAPKAEPAQKTEEQAEAKPATKPEPVETVPSEEPEPKQQTAVKTEESAAPQPAPEPEPQRIVREVKTIIAKARETRLQRTYPVTVLASQQINLSFRVSGKLVELPVRAGQRVKQGDVIAKLDERDFNSEIKQLQTQIDQANEQLKALETGARAEDVAALEAALAVEEALVEEAKAQLARTKYLFDKKIVAPARMEKDQTALRVAEAKLEAKRQELLKGQAGGREEEVKAQQSVVEGLQTQMQGLKDKLADATLRAPIDGIIAERKVENFINVQAQEPIATLQTLDALKLSFNAPAPDIPLLARAIQNGGIERKVILDALPGKELIAEEGEFSTQADPATQTYQGTVSIPDTGGEAILPGMAGRLIVTANASSKEAISLPVSAVASDPDGSSFVWVVNQADNTVSKQEVRTGGASGGRVTIASGIDEGTMVVTAGLSALQDGMEIRPNVISGQ